jgi:recombination protein RecT
MANVEELKQSAGTAVVPQKKLSELKPKEQVAYLLQQKKSEIAKMLPKTLSIERLLKVAQIAATTTPQLAKCDVPSLVSAIGQCAQLGLEPNTVLGHAYLVPFNTKRKDANGNEKWVNSVQVIIGYKGLIELARRSGQIQSLSAHEVCQNDEFKLVYGLNETLEHTPAYKDRGDVIGFYAIAKFKDGGHVFEFMSTHQINEIKEASQGYQQAKKYNKQATHPWTVYFVEMGRKTVIRRLSKYLPLSIEFASAVALDASAASGKEQQVESIDGEFIVTGFDDDGNGQQQQEEEQKPSGAPVASSIEAGKQNNAAQDGAGAAGNTRQAATGTTDQAEALPTAEELIARLQKCETVDEINAFGAAKPFDHLPAAEKKKVRQAAAKRAEAITEAAAAAYRRAAEGDDEPGDEQAPE